MRALIAGVAAVTVLASGCAAAAGGAALQEKRPLHDAAVKCTVLRTEGDGGHTLNLDTKGKDDVESARYVSVADAACVLSATGVPDSVVAQIDRTTSMMGVQTAEWGDGIKASWTYHPDNGLDIILTDQ